MIGVSKNLLVGVRFSHPLLIRSLKAFKIMAFRLFCFSPKRAGYHSGYQNWYPEFDTRQTNIWFDLLFLNFFTTDMFNFYLKKLYSFSRTFYFFIDQLFIRIVFRRKLFQDFCCFCSFFLPDGICQIQPCSAQTVPMLLLLQFHFRKR